MNVVVVTPVYKCKLEWLQRCIESVAAQTHECEHLVINDGDDPDIFDFLESHERVTIYDLPVCHNNQGDSPRSIGALSAFTLGADAVCWLDADNWFAPNHVESLVQLHQKSRAPFCSSSRYLCHLDGTLLGKCPETDPSVFIDANCYFVTRQAKQLANIWWMMEDRYHPVSDRVIMKVVSERDIRHEHSFRPTAIAHLWRTRRGCSFRWL